MSNDIANIDTYLKRMSKTMIDKIFFMDKVEATVFVDYGCADGVLLRLLKSMFPDNIYYGYDASAEMIAKAGANEPNLTFTDDLYFIQGMVDAHKRSGKKVCVILSSVIHEVYSYGPENVNKFWKELFALEAEYIAIRDMCVSITASRPADPISVARIRQLADPAMMTAWEAQWGSLDENWSLTHFLLKYHYADNWTRELPENYLPINKEQLLQKFPRVYRPELIEHYTLPFLRNKVQNDFDVNLQERTHLKLIMKRA